MNAQISQEALDRVILQVTVTSVHLQTVVNNVETFVSGELLCHGTVHSVIWISCHDQISTMSHHQSRCLEISRHFCQLELQMLVRSNRLAELLSTLDVICSCLDAGSGAPK